jgi:hypothetical protein
MSSQSSENTKTEFPHKIFDEDICEHKVVITKVKQYAYNSLEYDYDKNDYTIGRMEIQIMKRTPKHLRIYDPYNVRSFLWKIENDKFGEYIWMRKFLDTNGRDIENYEGKFIHTFHSILRPDMKIYEKKIKVIRRKKQV